MCGAEIISRIARFVKNHTNDQVNPEQTQEVQRLQAELEQLRQRLEKLAESEEQFRSISENMPGVVFMYHVYPDARRTYLYSSPGMTDLVGPETAAWVGNDPTRYFQLLPEEDYTMLQQRAEALESEYGVLDVEYRLRTDGPLKWVRSTSRAVQLPDGAVRWQGVVLDITERKRAAEVERIVMRLAEATLESQDLADLIRTVRSLLGKLINTQNFYVAIYNPERRTYSFPYYEDEYDKLEEYEEFSLEGSLTDYVRRTGRPLLCDNERFEELEKQGEVRLVGTNNQIWLGAPLVTEKRVIGVVVVQSYQQKNLYTEADLELLNNAARHIAVAIERFRYRAAMQESEKLKVAQNLARAVAHEFRQPLSTLSLIDDLVRMEEEGRLEEHTLQRMRNAINRIDGLVEKLLTITRLESIPYAMGLDMVDLERSSQREGSLPAEPDGENDLY